MDGNSVPLDFSIDELLESLSFGISIHFEAAKRNKTAILDVSFRDYGHEDANNRFTTIDLLAVEGSGAFVMIEPFELIAGVRYFNISSKVEENAIDIGNRSHNWVDPIIGGRYIWDFARFWALIFRADIGGFGVGSEFSWNSVAVASRRLGNLSVLGGLRVWSVDYKTGSGPDRFEYNVISWGPAIGMTFHF